MELNYKFIIASILVIVILLRIILLFITPISMFTDGIIRYLPDAQKVLLGDFLFNDMPLFTIIEAFWMLLFQGNMLLIALKMTSFIFFLGILFLLPKLFKKLNLKKKEKIIISVLFLFSVWSLLLSVTIMQDMMLVFFTLALFIAIGNYLEKSNSKYFILSLILVLLITLTKITGYLILLGFCFFIITKDKKFGLKKKIKDILPLIIGIILGALWILKNYLTTGLIHITSMKAPIYIHSFSEYINQFIKFFHYFWEIPIPSKVNFIGITSIFYNIYYIGALIIMASMSLLIIFSLIRYGKKYKQFIFLILPLFCFVFYWTFIIFWAFHDGGRYTFPLWFFMFFFLSKFITNLKNKNARRFCHIIIVLFCILSIISAFGISLHMNSIDNQIMEMKEKLGQENLENVTIISNTEFAAASLNYYLKNYLKDPIQFNMKRNVIHPNIKCEGTQIFNSENFKIFKENKEYRICRK